jgi:hypothetical protein
MRPGKDLRYKTDTEMEITSIVANDEDGRQASPAEIEEKG